ncbi:putative ribonuclease H-like domain-containing protein [Tanacetum coccineum]
MVLLRVPRKHNMYTFNLNNLAPKENLACLVAKASSDEAIKWHRRMTHVNYKNMNKLVKDNLVRGLPPKLFKNDHTCVACCKGKQHKATYKAIIVVSSISEHLQLLHMDLFGPTSIQSVDHKYYCLVITDDYSRFCWVFFLEIKDEIYSILKDFISLVENQLNKKVKSIRCDNGTEFKNAKLIELCGEKGIKRDYSNARTPHQNGDAKRKNRTLIEAARTMLADSKLPTMFWTEAVCTACYVLNRVLITNPHNKTPYALLTGKTPSISHFKPFGCHVTILNTSDHLGKFDGEADEGYLVGYSASYNRDKANQSVGTQDVFSNPAGFKDDDSDSDSDEQVILELARLKDQEQRATTEAERLGLGFAKAAEELQKRASAKTVPPGSTGSIPVPSGDTTISPGDVSVPTGGVPVPTDLGNNEPSPGIFSSLSYDDEFGADLNNLASTMEEEGIDYDEVFAPVAGIEAIRLFLAFASYMDFMVFGGTFFNHPNKVYHGSQGSIWTIIKHQYLEWQPILNISTFLLKHGYRRGTIDKTLFLKKHKRDIILVQVYVDDIIFGSTKKAWCDEFEALMKGECEMSAMGELLSS